MRLYKFLAHTSTWDSTLVLHTVINHEPLCIGSIVSINSINNPFIVKRLIYMMELIRSPGYSGINYIKDVNRVSIAMKHNKYTVNQDYPLNLYRRPNETL